MPKLALQQVRGIRDVLRSDAYTLEFGTVPLTGDGEANTSQLTLACQNAALPGVSNEVQEVVLAGHTVRFRGRPIWEGNLSVTFVVPDDMVVYRTLHSWHQYVVNTDSGASSGNKQDYAVDARMVLYNNLGEETHIATVFGVFPQEVATLEMDGTSSNLSTIQATFAYDYAEHQGTPHT